MNVSTFFTQKHLGGFAVPAVITPPTNAAKEISVIFKRERGNSSFSGIAAENDMAIADLQTSEIGTLTITNQGANAGDTTLNISDLLYDDNGYILTNENDEPLYADGQFNGVIKTKFRDAEGFTRAELTEA